MSKKQPNYIPLTIGEYEEFLRLYTKIKDIAEALGRAKFLAQDDYMEGIDSFTLEGVYVYSDSGYGYDLCRNIELIHIDALLNPTLYSDVWEKEIALKEKESKDKNEEYDRIQYEKLKAKFEGQ